MTVRFIIILVLTISFISSCIVDSDLPLPKAEREIVVNCILNPDSIIKVQLSHTRTLDSMEPFQVVENATIKLFENDVLIDTLDYDGQGNYLALGKPSVGMLYKIIVSGSDIKIDIEAEDKIPSRPVYTACYEKSVDQKSTESDVTIHMNLVNLDGDLFQPWIELISHDYKYDYRGNDTTTLLITKFSYIDTNSPFLDIFNSTFDNYNGFNQYAFYLRLDDAFAHSKELGIDIVGGIGLGNSSSRLFKYDVLTNPIKDQALISVVYNCSPAYDKYLKSTMLDFINNEFLGTPIPFSGPVKIFSNIKNGTGIFAAYSLTSFRLDTSKCK